MNLEASALQAQVRESYGTPGALAAYRRRMDAGLRIWETTVVERHFPARGRVLTVGCGCGRETFALEKLGYEVVGVDICLPLLQVAHDARAQRGHRASFLLVDGATLPFGDGSFDAVTLWAQMLDNVPTSAARGALMQEVHRVLHVGGVATFSVHDDERTRPELEARSVLSADTPERGDFVLDDDREHTVRYSHYFTRQEVEGLCREAGFRESLIVHTSDVGEVWGNVLVGACRK
jgi:ubiquinone/menaquinone biosynthesis C-methylase UbiE